MSKTKRHHLKASRVQVSNLEQRERELKNHEAETVKGGGGAAGGIVMRNDLNRATNRSKGEEIPS